MLPACCSDQARLLWNADADRRPVVVARCSSTADVVAAVRHAQADRAQDAWTVLPMPAESYAGHRDLEVTGAF
jgi:hypothetical protein